MIFLDNFVVKNVKKEKVYLYLLELENGKYYVGQTDNVTFRFDEHNNGLGAKWTRLNKPVCILKTKEIYVEDIREALLYENWMTLHYMEKFGWENVRGGEIVIIESYKLIEQLKNIFDINSNKIKYYIKSQYLFGVVNAWIIYVLELENNKFYIGSTKRLGNSLGKHYNGTSTKWTKVNKPKQVIEVIVVKDSNYLTIKKELLNDYIKKYGFNNVIGGQNN
jgi:predicted GIY-YIG superfamily endonuclease